MLFFDCQAAPLQLLSWNLSWRRFSTLGLSVGGVHFQVAVVRSDSTWTRSRSSVFSYFHRYDDDMHSNSRDTVLQFCLSNSSAAWHPGWRGRWSLRGGTTQQKIQRFADLLGWPSYDVWRRQKWQGPSWLAGAILVSLQTLQFFHVPDRSGWSLYQTFDEWWGHAASVADCRWSHAAEGCGVGPAKRPQIWRGSLVAQALLDSAFRVPHPTSSNQILIKRYLIYATVVFFIQSHPTISNAQDSHEFISFKYHANTIHDRRKFRSQNSDNMDRWKAEQGRGREKRKIRRKKSRRERVRRKKMQMREKVGKSRNIAKHCVFPMIRGSGGSKSRLAKAAGAEPAGQMRDENLHAVVARSTFWSQNVQSTPFSDHFWKLRYWKSGRRCGAKHILKSKCAKHTSVGPLLEVEMSKKWTPLWREAHFEGHNGVHFFNISTSKSGPRMVCFVHFDFKMCFAPQRRPLFRHLNFQKWSDAGVFCTFWLQNVLRATTASTFSISQLPKVVREWCALYILTSKCASRHNGVHFFDISTSKSGPTLVCFVHFDFKMCFAQNVQSTPFSDHFWKLRYWKSGRRCGAKHISKSKCTKHHMFAPLLEVRMSKKCTPLWREALEVKMYKTLGVWTTFGGSDVASPLRFTTLHYVTLHHTPLYYTTLHYTTLHNTTTTTTQLDYTPLHSTTLNFTTLHYTTLRSTTLHYIKLHYTPLHYITLHYAPQHYNYNYTTTLHYTPLHWITLHYTTLRYTTLHYTTLHYTTLHYTTLPSTTLHYITLHYTPLHYNYNYDYTTTLHYTKLHYTTLHYTTLHYIPLHSTTLHYTTLQYTEWHCATDRQVDR